jgi:hypothetical protein
MKMAAKMFILLLAMFAYGNAEDNVLESAVSAYLGSNIAPQYSKGDVTIPVVNILAVDSSKGNETLVWGSFWVFNYELRGNTLFCVSGGEHSGLAHLQKTKDGKYLVKKLDVPEDGAGFTKSAKKIFGKQYESFMKVHSDEALREGKRAQTIRDYVKDKKLPVTKYQDYGWEAKSI